MKSSRCLDRLTIRCCLPVGSERGVTSSGVFSFAFGAPVSPELRLHVTYRLSVIRYCNSKWHHCFTGFKKVSVVSTIQFAVAGAH